ncbi:DUF1963 domain-containing protein [Yoonia sp. R2-816]|uniref:DUF1963 domain-containing protein n=1 Tax=Yoonia sp. R2-816 TaxID=3342638 RepID=UPI0037267949
MTDPKLSDVEIDGYLSHIRKQAAFMLRADRQSDDGMPGCYFGGEPTLPADIEWPIYHCPEPKLDIPLHFIFQVNLKYLPKSLDFPEFPQKGTVFAFVEPMFAWADPSAPEPLLNGQGAKLIYVADDVSDCPLRKAPALPDLDKPDSDGWALSDEPDLDNYLRMRDEYGVTGASGLNKWPMYFLIGDTFTQLEILKEQNVDFGYTDLDNMEFARAFDSATDSSFNRCRAYAKDKLNLKSEYGIPHWAFGADGMYNFPSREFVERLYPGRGLPALTAEHVILFSLCGKDSEIGYCRFNQYRMSFWIHPDDLAKGNFSNVQVWEVV